MFGSTYCGDVTGDGAVDTGRALDHNVIPQPLIFTPAYGDTTADIDLEEPAYYDMASSPLATQPSTNAQEQAALMYGSRYSGDVTGDGAGEQPQHCRHPNMRPMSAMLYPGAVLPSIPLTPHGLQLASNLMGGGERAAQDLVRFLGGDPAPDGYDLHTFEELQAL